MFKEIVEFSKELEKEGIFSLSKEKEAIKEGNIIILPIKENIEDFIIDINKICSVIVENFEIKTDKKINCDKDFLYICKNVKYLTRKFPSDIKGNKSIGANKGLNSYHWFIFEVKDKKDFEKKLYKEKLSKTYNQKNANIFLDENRKYFKKEYHSKIEKFIINLPNLLVNNNIKSRVLNIFVKNIYCIIYFSKNISKDNNYDFYEQMYWQYLKKNIFKQNKVLNTSCNICKNNKGVFMPESFNNLAGSNGMSSGGKKPFILHQNRPNILNITLCQECAFDIFKFQRFFLEDLKVSLFPLFIDQELKTAEIKLLTRFKNADGIGFAGFKKVLYSVSKNYKDDLSFYLVVYSSNNNILAFDYITGYKYHLNSPVINYPFYEKEEDISIRNIFHIERELDFLFDNTLINNYFEDKIKDKSGKGFLINLIYKYRMPIFNLIYRNNKNEFSLLNLEEIFLIQVKHKMLNTSISDIKKFINHFVSLYIALKDNIYKDEGGKNMEELRTLSDRLIDVIKNADTQEKLKNDIENFLKTLNEYQNKIIFGFLIGQVVYYILSKSKAGDKTHALLEGFINVGNLGILAERIKEYFNKYKHEIGFNYWKFNQIMSNVIMFCYDNKNLSLREIETVFYIGYFDTNVFYQN